MSTEKQKPEKDPEKDPIPKGLLNTTQLHEKFDLDRATILKRLKQAGIKPAFERAKLKCWRLTDKGKDGRTLRQILEEADDTKLTEAKTRKMLVSAAREEFKLEMDQGNFFSRAEVKQHAFAFVSAMVKRLGKIYPRQAAPRLFKTRTVVELQRMMETDVLLIFDELKRDYPDIF